MANEILTEIFEYLKIEEKELRIFHLNNVLLVNYQWYECASRVAYEEIYVKDTSVGILGKKFEKDKAPLWAKHVRSIKINHITYIPFDFYISDVCKKCKNLEKLFITGDYCIINNTSLKDIVKNCKLKELTLQYNFNIRPKTIKEIPKLFSAFF